MSPCYERETHFFPHEISQLLFGNHSSKQTKIKTLAVYVYVATNKNYSIDLAIILLNNNGHGFPLDVSPQQG